MRVHFMGLNKGTQMEGLGVIGAARRSPQPAPGSAPATGRTMVPAERFRQALGVMAVNFIAGTHSPTIVDIPLG